MLVGLDLGLCIADLCLGRQRIVDVAKVYAPTAARTTEAFQEAVVAYQQGAWQAWPEATEIALLLWNGHKIDQHTLRGVHDWVGTPVWVDESDDPHQR